MRHPSECLPRRRMSSRNGRKPIERGLPFEDLVGSEVKVLVDGASLAADH